MSDQEIMLKSIFIGNLSVGKTSIILRYTNNIFQGEYIPTIGADFTTTPLKYIEEEERIGEDSLRSIVQQQGLSMDEFEEINSQFSREDMVYIWDLAGQPLFQKIRTYYMSHSFIAFLVVDLSHPDSFKISQWVSDLKKYSPNSDFILVANKSDLVDLEDSSLQKQIRKRLEKKYNKKVHIVSALTGKGVDELFIEAKITMMQKYLR